MNAKATLILSGIVLTLGFAALMTSFALGKAQRERAQTSRPVEYAPPLRLPPPAPVPAPGHLGFELQVDPDDPQAATIETIAAQLKAANPTPAVRIERFRWLDNPNMRVDGWHGQIEELTTTRNGWIATIRVTPRVTSTFGAATTIADQIIEKYASVNGQLQFLGAEEIPGPSRYGSFLTH